MSGGVQEVEVKKAHDAQDVDVSVLARSSLLTSKRHLPGSRASLKMRGEGEAFGSLVIQGRENAARQDHSAVSSKATTSRPGEGSAASADFENDMEDFSPTDRISIQERGFTPAEGSAVRGTTHSSEFSYGSVPRSSAAADQAGMMATLQPVSGRESSKYETVDAARPPAWLMRQASLDPHQGPHLRYYFLSIDFISRTMMSQSHSCKNKVGTLSILECCSTSTTMPMRYGYLPF